VSTAAGRCEIKGGILEIRPGACLLSLALIGSGETDGWRSERRSDTASCSNSSRNRGAKELQSLKKKRETETKSRQRHRQLVVVLCEQRVAEEKRSLARISCYCDYCCD
jgi:hypothetical protein